MHSFRPWQLRLAALLLTCLGLAGLTALSHLLLVPAPASPHLRYVLHAPEQSDWNHDESWQQAPAERADAPLATTEVPPQWLARYSATRRSRALMRHGADPAIAQAAENAWQWLRQQQANDGSWGNGNRSGFTALALLGALGQGDSPCQPNSAIPTASPSSRALSFLLQQLQKPSSVLLQPRSLTGSRIDSAFAQSLCAYALAECLHSSPMSPRAFPQLRSACRKLSDILLDDQRDTAMPAALLRWDLQALRCLSLHADALQISAPSLAHSISRIESQLRGIEQQEVIDLGPLGGHRSRDPQQRALARNPFFLFYFQAQMPQASPAQWQEWHQHLCGQLLPEQLENGSWPGNSESPWHCVPNLHSAHANTCLALLMLQSFYRYTDPEGS